jgi:hypothetical protein
MTKDSIEAMNVETVYISRTKTSRDVKAKYLGLKHEAAIAPDNIRFWKIKATSSLDSFKAYLIENLNDILDSCKQYDCEQISYIDYAPENTVKELELADSDICVMEVVSDISPALFELKEVEIKEGSCEWCRDRKKLRFHCVCKEVNFFNQRLGIAVSHVWKMIRTTIPETARRNSKPKNLN